MQPTKQEYEKMSQESSPPSKLGKNCMMAFVIGGLICVLGQFLSTMYMDWGMVKGDALSLSSVTLIFLSALSTGIGIYDDIAKLAGAGTLVPITGFANAMASPAIEFKHEGFVAGLSAKLFIIAGPVITYGISASVIYGVVLYLFLSM